MKINFTHITFMVSHFERSFKFYKKYCGLVIVHDRRLEGGGTVWLGSPSQVKQNVFDFVFVLEEGKVTSTLDHLGFQCENRSDLDSIAEIAKAEGILFAGPVDVGGSIGSYVMIKDPDGHIVEFTCGQRIKGISIS